MSHQCTARCVCPIHQTPMRYWPAGDDHACLVDDCPNAQGFRSADAGTIEVTIVPDVARLKAALTEASSRITALRGIGLAAYAATAYARTIAQTQERQVEHDRTRELGPVIGLTRQDTDAIIEQVLTEAAKRWDWYMSTREIYQEARRGLHAHANGLPFLPFRQSLEPFLAKPADGKGRPEYL